MATSKMTLVDWLDDLCVRFIVNLPNEELQSVERICFQIEEAQWFYEDFIRPLDPTRLPSMHLRKFSQLMFQHCPLFSAYSEALHTQAYEQFLAYKTRVPVRGAIMLNADMTHAVLVKGWKKSAKWSFPRGKINKEETDLDCAVREVYEETGYDLYAGNLVAPEEHMKKITVTMREQSMMLYVFRGVPMDTYFEPRTRKEISKIDWYKLTDLPTLRRKHQGRENSHHPGHAHAQDQVKESSFYMVAPFLGPLRAWIKQQHKLDKQKTRASAHVAAPPVAMTDDDEPQPDLYEASADAPIPAARIPSADNLAQLVAQLGQARPSDTAPALSYQQHEPHPRAPDPAAELKRLLSVGVGVHSPPVEAPSQPAPTQPLNPLLALFRQGSNGQQSPHMAPPRTPFDQIMPSPMQPSSPHGQHQPRQPQVANIAPPPSFPYHQQHQQMPSQGPPFPPSNQYMSPPQHRNSPPPNMQQVFDQRNPRMVQETSDSRFAGDHGRPTIPSASKLPAPNLNAHALGLLNSFKNSDARPKPHPPPLATQQAPPSAHNSLRIQKPLPQQHAHDLTSPRGSYAPSPPQFQSPAVSRNFQPEQPTPRSLHQDSLLTLFTSTSPAGVSPEPVELCAHPKTPGHMAAQPVSNAAKPQNTDLPNASVARSSKNSVTQATGNGPVHARDLATLKHSHPVSNGSPVSSPQKSVRPQQILKRGTSRASSEATVILPKAASQNAAKAPNAPQAPFKPQILKRPQQPQQPPQPQNAILAPAPTQTAHTQGLLDMFKGPSPQPASPLASRFPGPPAGYKQGLLDMFKGPSPQPTTVQSTHSAVPPTGHTQGLIDLFKDSSSQPTITQPILTQTRHSPALPAERQQSLLNMLKNPSPEPPPPPQSTTDTSTSHKTDLLALFSKQPAQAKGASCPQPPPLQPSCSPAPMVFPLLTKHTESLSGLISPISPVPGSGGAITGESRRDEGVGLLGRGGSSGAGTTSRLRGGPSVDGGKSPVDKTFLLGLLENVARTG